MPGLLNSLLLKVFRALIYGKRGIFWAGKGIGKWVGGISGFAVKKGGFYLYQLSYKLVRRLGLTTAPLSSKIKEFFSSSSSLRLLLFFILAFFVSTETKLYAKPLDIISDRNNLLISMTKDDEELFFVEESPARVNIKTSDLPAAEYVAPGFSFFSRAGEPDFQRLAAISPGDQALMKPIIITGSLVSKQRLEPIAYVVQEGDTLSSVAQKFGISIQTLLWENDLSATSIIKLGRNLTILPVSGVVHKVKKGETLSRLASLYKVNEEEILKYNRISDSASIQTNDSLIIPGGAKILPKSTQPRLVSLPSRPGGASPFTGKSKYIWPTSARRITQYFTWRHSGVDIAGPVGTPLYASRAGRVVQASCGWNGGYGCNVRIDHGDGYLTLYAHASKLFARVGDYVSQGQHIAAMGSTGRSTGSHIHFEVRRGGRRLNPFQYIR